ncbi:hypothetical protein MG293_010675 [Ovis ammon polii]|uniref:Uncharacterized protein n=1 Tax=Ovis ammon polii TaxID=230172 RepID=A0AAD4U2Q1_OVIAM|nr:hypothetical protein MG293_010675 [Ovis ammon polii]
MVSRTSVPKMLLIAEYMILAMVVSCSGSKFERVCSMKQSRMFWRRKYGDPALGTQARKEQSQQAPVTSRSSQSRQSHLSFLPLSGFNEERIIKEKVSWRGGEEYEIQSPILRWRSAFKGSNDGISLFTTGDRIWNIIETMGSECVGKPLKARQVEIQKYILKKPKKPVLQDCK